MQTWVKQVTGQYICVVLYQSGGLNSQSGPLVTAAVEWQRYFIVLSVTLYTTISGYQNIEETKIISVCQLNNHSFLVLFHLCSIFVQS